MYLGVDQHHSAMWSLLTSTILPCDHWVVTVMTVKSKGRFPCTRFWQPRGAGGGRLRIPPTYLLWIVSNWAVAASGHPRGWWKIDQWAIFSWAAQLSRLGISSNCVLWLGFPSNFQNGRRTSDHSIEGETYTHTHTKTKQKKHKKNQQTHGICRWCQDGWTVF